MPIFGWQFGRCQTVIDMCGQSILYLVILYFMDGNLGGNFVILFLRFTWCVLLMKWFQCILIKEKIGIKIFTDRTLDNVYNLHPSEITCTLYVDNYNGVRQLCVWCCEVVMLLYSQGGKEHLRDGGCSSSWIRWRSLGLGVCLRREQPVLSWKQSSAYPLMHLWTHHI